MAKTYITPQLPPGAEIAVLRKEDDKANELTPETIVVCINRGRRPLTDMFDAQTYPIPTGYVSMPYGAAVHFQKRQVVPGTRVPGGAHLSWIGILGVDKPEACTPFTDEELERFGEAKEGINRAAMPGPAGQVTILTTSDARSNVAGEGLVGGIGAGLSAGAMRPDLSLVGDTPAGREAAERAMDPVQGSDAKGDEAEGRAAGWQPAEVAGDAAPRRGRQR